MTQRKPIYHELAYGCGAWMLSVFFVLNTVGYVDAQPWRTYTIVDGLGNQVVSSLQATNGALWLGTNHGVSRFQTDTWTTFTSSDGLVDDLIWSVYSSSDGALWFGTNNGVSRFQNDNWTSFTSSDGLADNLVWSIYQSSDGALWFGTNNGVSRFQNNIWTTFTLSDGLAHNSVIDIYQSSDGALWFGTNNGVSRFHNDTWTSFTSSDGLADNLVWSVYQSLDGALWFGTNNGVSRFHNDNWTTFTSSDGLADNLVWSVYQSLDGALWFGTNNGVGRFHNDTWTTYNISDGLANGIVNDIAEEPEGVLWFATNGGVSTFQLEASRPDDQEPSHAEIDTKIISSIPDLIGTDTLTVFVQSTLDNIPVLLEVSHALTEGQALPLAQDWSAFSRSQSIQLAGLSNGTKTLYVRARSDSGVVDTSYASVRFAVDLTGPTVAILSPQQGDVLMTSTSIFGSVFDRSSDLASYFIEYRHLDIENSDWVAVGDTKTSAVENGILGTWNVVGLVGGEYELRVVAVDQLQHRETQSIRVHITAPEDKVDSGLHGYQVQSFDKLATLILPPSALSASEQIRMIAYQPQVIPQVPGADFTGIAYTLIPPNISFSKTSTLVLNYGALSGYTAQNLTIYRFENNQTWARIGGTIDESKKEIAVGIAQTGTYGLFAEQQSQGKAFVTNLTCRPRVISPGGQMFPAETSIIFQLDARAPVQVRVFGASGNLIKEIITGQILNAGSNVVVWDGKKDTGKPVTSGPYLVVVQTPVNSLNKTVMVLNR